MKIRLSYYRIAQLLLVFLILFNVIILVNASENDKNGFVNVYITDTGSCYHRNGCTYLHSKIEIKLRDAVEEGYYACSRCDPPALGKYSSTDDDEYLSYEQRLELKKAEEEKQAQLAQEEATKAQQELKQIQQQKLEEQKAKENKQKISNIIVLLIYVFFFFCFLTSGSAKKKRSKK